MTSGKAPPMRASKQIARNTFDPEIIADHSALGCLRMNTYCELNNIGVRFQPTRRSVQVREVKPFGLIEAQSDAGPVGRFIEYLRSHGWFSKSEEAIERLTYEALQQQNSAHRKHLDKIRNNHAVVREENGHRLSLHKSRMAWRIAARGQLWLDGTAPMIPIEPRRNVLADLMDQAPEDPPKRIRGLKGVRA